MKDFRQLWNSPRFHRWGIPILIFLLAFLPRVLYPVSRTPLWSDRAFHFGQAVLDGDWAMTFRRYHPGVTIMWLAGIGLHIFSYFQGGLSPDQIAGMAPTRPGTLTASVTAAIVPVALVIALGLALSYPVLRRLTGEKIALTGALLLALDPFYITYSKVIHPDGLLATFMLLSALLLLLYVQQQRHRYLMLSGAVGGLAFLSKSPSLFLVPYVTLILSTVAFAPLLAQRNFQLRQIGRRGMGVAVNLLLWLAAAAVIFVALWPAMWVTPDDVLQRMVERIIYHATTAHPNPVFFNGQIYEVDPGPLFYLATLAWKSTVITLPAFLAALVFVFRRWRIPAGRVLLALITYAFFYFLQMSLGDYKQIAYILPVGPALALIAAIGLVWTVEAVSRRVGRGRLQPGIITPLLLGAALAVQLAIIVKHHPYMGTHYNWLLGGAQVAQRILPLQDQGEGLDLAARYLSQLPHGQDKTANVYQRSAIVFQREFVGRTSTSYFPWATYRVYAINEVVRQMAEPEWQEGWEADRQTEPLYTVSFDGIPYVWVYGTVPQDPTPGAPRVEVSYEVGDHFLLQGYGISRPTIQAGDTLTVDLLWTANALVDEDYVVFNHLLSPDGTLVAQQDNQPLAGIRPTSTWRPGEQLEDVYHLSIGDEVTPGVYEWSVGMYDQETLQRLPVYDAAGERVPQDRIVLATVTVTAPEATGEEQE